HGFGVLTLVHDNGVHGLGVNYCKCPGSQPLHEQLLVHGLFPASTAAPATAFHYPSLDKALVEEAECHVTTEPWWKKIARLTHPDDPGATVNKYPVALRVRREHRALSQYMDFGLAHQDPASRRAPDPGEMVYRCVACPFIWNVPPNFNDLPPEQKDLYINAWILDGNMKAEHTTSRRPGNNVQIFPGTGFFPDPVDFAAKTAKPMTDKALPPDLLCHQHTAAGAVAGKADPSRDVRGILSLCCARHGILLAGGTVDIPFAEKY
ncbi:hypothetical protein PENSPDRAFT_566178, partial [Peniophora sp. CONT]